MSRQRRQQRRSRTGSSRSSRSGAEHQPARAEEAAAESPSWWESAGSWIAEKYDDVSTAVGDGIDSAKETLSDGWDVLTNSDMDVDWGERKVSVSTDMDEVMDLMPEDVRAALELDRNAEGANEVTMELDYRNDTMTIVSKDIRIMGVNTPEMQAKGTSLRDVRITITGQGGLPMVGNATSTSVDIQFSQAIANEITANTENGPVSATRVELGMTSVNMTGAGNELPTGETSAARFYVSNAVVDGLSTPQGGADQVRVDALNAGMDQEAGTGFVDAGTIAASGAHSQGSTIGETSVSGARVDMMKDADGVTQHTVAVTGASVSDVQTASGDRIANANMANVQATHGGGALSLAAEELGVRGMSGTTRLDEATVSGLDVQAAGIDGAGWSGSLEASGATVRGLESGTARIGSADVQNLAASARNTEAGIEGDASIASGRASGIRAGNTSMGSMFVREVDASMRQTDSGATVNASATRADVNQIRTNGTSVGHVGVDYLSTEQRGRNDATYQAGRVRASDVNAEGTTVGSMDSRGVYVDSRAETIAARARTLSVSDVNAGQTTIAGADAAGMSVDVNRATGIDASVDSISGRGVQTVIAGQQSTIGEGSAEGVHLTTRGDQADATVRSANVRDVALGEHTMGSAQLTGLRGGHGPDASHVSADEIGLAALRSGEHSADAVTIRSVAAEQSGSTGSVRADSVSADGLVSGSNRLTRLEATGLSAERDGAASSGTIARVDAQGITTAAGTVDRASVLDIEASANAERQRLTAGAASATRVDMGEHGVGAMWASGLSAESDAQGQRGGVESFRAVDARTTGLTVGEVNASGLLGAREGDTTHMSMSTGEATDIAHRSGATRADVGRVQVDGAVANMGPGGVVGGADMVRASNLRGRTVSSGEGGGMSPELIRSLGGAVQDADIRASVPMRQGRYGEGMGELGVGRGTSMNANVAIRNGHFVPGAARADFSRNLDGPAWVGVRGAYLNTDGELRADLAGAPNINLGKSMGLGSRIDTSVANHAARAAEGSGGPARTESSLADSFDMSGATVDAAVRMRNGQMDLGGGNSATLAGRNATDNVVQVQGGMQQDLVMTFTRFLTSSLRMGAGGGQVSAAGASVEQGRVTMDPNAQQGTAIEGTVGNITLRDVRGSN